MWPGGRHEKDPDRAGAQDRSRRALLAKGSGATRGPEWITGSETSACVGCTLGSACTFFPAALAAEAALGFDPSRCASKPSGVDVVPLGPGVVAFSIPPGVMGNGSPNTENGVMTYHGYQGEGSWEALCTLPAAEKPLCTVDLNQFVRSYGSL